MSHQINSVVPNHGQAADRVTINGTGFGAVQGLNSAVFSVDQTPNVVSWSDTAIVVDVPAGGVTGAVDVLVADLSAVSPTNANFFRYTTQQFPALLDDIVMQNQENDSSPEDLQIADAGDFNSIAETLIAVQNKIGIDNSLVTTSLDSMLRSRALALRALSLHFFETVPGGVLTVPNEDVVPAGGLHTIQSFPAGADRELLVRFTVPRNANPSAGMNLSVKPIFLLDQAPGGADVIVLDAYGQAGMTTLASSQTAMPVNAATEDTFLVGQEIRAIPLATAGPLTRVALRISRVGTNAADNYAGAFQLDSILVEYEV